MTNRNQHVTVCCGNCNHVMRAAGELVGRVGTCRKCGTPVEIRGQSAPESQQRATTVRDAIMQRAKNKRSHQHGGANGSVPANETFNPDDTLFSAGGAEWKWRHAFQHFLAIGATGSGKTSFLRTLMLEQICKSQAGCWMPTVKESDAAEAVAIAERNGAAHRVKRIRLDSHFRLDFLQWALDRQDTSGITANIAELLVSMSRIRQSESERGSADRFWEDYLKRLLLETIDLSATADNNVSLDRLKKVISSLPESPDEAHSPDWQSSSLAYRLLQSGHEKEKNAIEQADFDDLAPFLLKSVPGLNPKTKTSVLAHWDALVAIFRGQVRQLFCAGEVNVYPEQTFDGAIVIVDIPIDKYGETAKVIQLLGKRLFQLAVQARTVTSDSTPVVLLQDEFQYYADFEVDSLFASNCRSKKCSIVSMSQSYDALLAAAGGGPKAEHVVGAYAANCVNKLFFNCSGRTADWASNQVGKTYKFLSHASGPAGGFMMPNQGSGMAGGSQQLLPILLESDLHSLKTGGPEFDNVVECIAFRGGKPFPAGSPIQKLSFKQRGEE